MAVLPKNLTLDEFLRRPERKPALEYEDGEVSQKVSPKGKHSALQAGAVDLFNRYGLAGKIARAFPELRTTYAGRSYVPDVSVFRWERVPLDPNGYVADEFFLPPDIAAEIVSPKQSTIALVRKCLWYVDNGVRAAILVDPADKTILVFRPDRPVLALRGADSADLSEVLPGFVLVASEVFSALLGR